MQRIFRLISRADDVKAGSGYFDELFTDGERFRIGELAVEVLQRRPWLMISVKPRGGPANGEARGTAVPSMIKGTGDRRRDFEAGPDGAGDDEEEEVEVPAAQARRWVKVPRSIRKGRAGRFLTSPLGVALISQAVMAAGALTAVKKADEASPLGHLRDNAGEALRQARGGR